MHFLPNLVKNESKKIKKIILSIWKRFLFLLFYRFSVNNLDKKFFRFSVNNPELLSVFPDFSSFRTFFKKILKSSPNNFSVFQNFELFRIDVTVFYIFILRISFILQNFYIHLIFHFTYF